MISLASFYRWENWNKEVVSLDSMWLNKDVSVQFSLVTQLCPTLCNPMNCSMPGLPVHHQLPEFSQTHVHWVGDAIQPYLILCCPLLLLPSIFASIRIFSNESALCIRWPKDWSFSFNISSSNEHPGLSPLGWTGWISLQSKGLSRVFYSQFKSINSLALSFLHSPTLASIHDHWKNHSLD